MCCCLYHQVDIVLAVNFIVCMTAVKVITCEGVRVEYGLNVCYNVILLHCDYLEGESMLPCMLSEEKRKPCCHRENHLIPL